MARYEHLPIYKRAFDLNVYVEQIVRHFSLYHNTRRRGWNSSDMDAF